VAISLHTSGSWAYAASGSVTPTLPTHSTGDMLIVRVAAKSSNIASLDITCATSGWARIGQFRDGTTNSGNGTGSVQVASFWKIAASASETDPTVDFSQTVTQVGHEARSYQKAAGETWSTPVGDGGPDTTVDASKSMTIASHVSVTAGDLVDFFMGIRDDTTMTVPTITQAGVTFAAVVESPDAAGIDTGGADGAYDGGYRIASSGTSSAAAVITGTLSTSETGSGWMTRLRVFTPETHSGSAVLTGGGVVTRTSQKNGLRTQVLTGGGVVTSTRIKQAAVAPIITGGGVVTRISTTNRNAAPGVTGGGIAAPVQTTARAASQTTTGGGVVSYTYSVFEGGEAHSGSAVITGGGVVTRASVKAAAAVLVGTGAGVVTSSRVKGAQTAPIITGSGVATSAAASTRLASVIGTGAGVVSLSIASARLAAALLSGGGVLTSIQTTARAASVVGTGGGVVTSTGGQVESHDGSAVVTGAGTVTATGTSARRVSVTLSGAGAAIAIGQGGRAALVMITGAGIAAVSWTGAHRGSAVLAGGGVVTVAGSSSEALEPDRNTLVATVSLLGGLTSSVRLLDELQAEVTIP